MVQTVGDVVARFFSEPRQDDKSAEWIEQAVSDLNLRVTGQLNFFEISKASWSTEDELIFQLGWPEKQNLNREVFALAEQAMASCYSSTGQGKDEIFDAVKAGRLAFLRGRIWNAICHCRPMSDFSVTQVEEYAEAQKSWELLEFPIDLIDVDRLTLSPMNVPSYMYPQGYTHSILAAHRDLFLQVIEPESTSLRKVAVSTLKKYLGGVALAWLDGAMLARNVDLALNLVAAAGNALSVASSLQADARERAIEAGRLGGLKRHARTRTLKEWALHEAATMGWDDKRIARTLAPRVPAELADASADVGRLIYDALRAARRSRFTPGD